MCQQIPDRGGAPAPISPDQPEGAQIVICRSVQLEQSPLPQLHHSDRGEGLGDRPDPEGRVFVDRSVGFDVSDAVSVEELGGPVADHSQHQADGRPAVHDLIDSGADLLLINFGHRTPSS
jgi:hypothetical protein